MPGNTTARGYGWDHQRTRAQWAPLVEQGQVTCRRAPYGQCLAPQPQILPGTPWDLGHPDHTCPAPIAPEHRRCNRATMTTARRQARTAHAPRQSRRW